MTKQELNTRQSSKYGSLDRIFNKQVIENYFITMRPELKYYAYRINSEYIRLFGTTTTIYVCGETFENADETICSMLKKIKLF